MLDILNVKIHNADYRQMITTHAQNFSPAETALLHDILQRFTFDPMQEQALAQAVILQSRFDPNASHIADMDDDEETTSICPHCLNPPIPPLRDYQMWRDK